MASITSLPATKTGSKAANLWRGIASTTTSASRTASAAHRGSAPGTSTSVIRAMFSGSPEVAIATGKPASTATRAITGPEWPAPSTAILGNRSETAGICTCNNFTLSAVGPNEAWSTMRPPTMATPEYDVLIVGARVAGATVAARLAQQGRQVLLVDRDEFPSDTISTHALAFNAVDSL